MKKRIFSVFKLSFTIFFIKTAIWYLIIYLSNTLKIDSILYGGYIPMWGFDLTVTFWFYLLFSITFFWIRGKYGVGRAKYFTVVGISLIFAAFFGVEHFISSEISYFFAGFFSYLIVILVINKYWISNYKNTDTLKDGITQ